MASWLFLGVSLWGAWFTWNALRPMHFGARRTTLSFAAGWLTGELALHHVLWQAIATAVFIGFGALASAPGQLGLVITLASWGGLLYGQWESSRAGEVCEAALRAGFGSDYEQRIRPELRGGLTREIDWRRILLPVPRRKGVEVTRNIQFSRAAGVDLHLDVYRHESHPQGAPVLFQIHGGGWIMGDKKEQALPLMYQLAEMGWVCVSANYRLSPHATFPEHLIDCKQALAWIREHIAEYGGNPDFVAVTGGSAGGHLCALVALTQNDPEYQPGFEQADTRVFCALPYYGVYDFTNRNRTWTHDGLEGVLEKQIMKGSKTEIPEAWDRASPITRIHEGTPPFFLVHGGSDTLVPVGEAREFSKALREKSREAHGFAEVPGAQHAFEIFPSLRTLQVNDAACRYLALMYSRYLEQEEERAPRLAAVPEPGAPA